MANGEGAFVFWNHQGWKGPEKGRWLHVHTTMYENKSDVDIQLTRAGTSRAVAVDSAKPQSSVTPSGGEDYAGRPFVGVDGNGLQQFALVVEECGCLSRPAGRIAWPPS